MVALRDIYFSIETWGALFSLIAALTILLTRHFDKSGSRKLMFTLLCSALLMVCDANAIFYRGSSAAAAPQIERWTTFFVYILSFLIMPLSAQYVSEIIYKRSGYKLYWEFIVWGLFSFGALLICANLFEENNEEKSFEHLKKAVQSMRKELSKFQLEDVLVHNRNAYSVNTNLIKCDYYDYLDRKPEALDLYRGEFLNQYSWAEVYIYHLENYR